MTDKNIYDYRDEVAEKLKSDLTTLSDKELRALKDELAEIRRRLRILAEIGGYSIFSSPNESAWFDTCRPFRDEVGRRERIKRHQKAEEERRKQLLEKVNKAIAQRPKNPTLIDVIAMANTQLGDDERVLKHEAGWRMIRQQSYNSPQFYLQDFDLYRWKWCTCKQGKKKQLIDQWEREIANAEYKLSQADIDAFSKDLADDIKQLGDML